METIGLVRKLAIVVIYTLAFWIVLPGALLALGFAADQSFGLVRVPSPWGWPLVVLGLCLDIWAGILLRLRGRGLPISALPPSRLVTTGPYHLARHPMYLGYHLALFGLALLIGSPGFLVIAGPGFLVGWLVYARIEERGLIRRFGSSYRFYQTEVGILPRFPLYRVAQALIFLRVFPVQVIGRANLPAGPFVTVSNHACYLDPVFLTRITARRIRFLATADVFRAHWSAWIFRRSGAIPLRRYHADPVACRTMLRLLAQGEIIGCEPEGERSFLGAYQGAQPTVARIVARLGVPVIPIGISGNYDAGPRWADALRRRSITIRIGPPIRFDGWDPKSAIDTAIRSLLPESEPSVHLDGVRREKLGRVLWACPNCIAEDGWNPSELTCRRCGVYYLPTAAGYFAKCDSQAFSLAALGMSLLSQKPPNDPITVVAHGFVEEALTGPIRSLDDLGEGRLQISPKELTFGSLAIPLHEIEAVMTERADTLEVATARVMWQFRVQDWSVLRLQWTIEHWRLRDQPSVSERPLLAGDATRKRAQVEVVG